MLALRTMSKHKRRRILGDYAFLAPQLVLFVGLTLLPFVLAGPMLLTDRIDFQDSRASYIGLSNFTRVFTDQSIAEEYWPALWRTVRFTILNYAMVYVFGLSLALLIYEVGFRTGFFTIIYLPMMVSGLATGYMAQMLFSRSTGTANLILNGLGMGMPIDIKLPSGTTVILPILVGWKYAGFNLAIFLAGLLSIPTETIEAAIVDGASYWQRLTRILFPQMAPSFIIATVFCMIGSFGVFDELMAMGATWGNQEAKFLSVIFFIYAFFADRMALGMTLALETFLPLTILAFLLQRLQKRLQYY
jgi:ABC-type sugar transport system permease subunit